MIESQVAINNATGLHARPASQLTSQAQKFKSQVLLIHNTKVIDAKSILNIMAGGLNKGCVITVRCEGIDEALAHDTMVSLISNMKD
jgi:phosphocarrier protein HPr